MQLVEQHIIKRSHPNWAFVDDASFASKNLYNLANYQMRQSFFETRKTLSMKKLYATVKGTDAYCGLPRKVSNWVLLGVAKNWTAYFRAHRQWRQCPEKFTGEPRIPRYKDKEKGRNVLTYELGAISRNKQLVARGIIKLSGLNLEIRTNQSTYSMVRIVPRKTHYVVEVVYTEPETQADINEDFILGVDIGLNNLAAITSNKPGFAPHLINGRPLKSTNTTTKPVPLSNPTLRIPNTVPPTESNR